jgi:hypothetical protein
MRARQQNFQPALDRLPRNRIPDLLLVVSKTGADMSMTLMRIFIGLFEPRRIACLLESREFVVREWFRYLKRHRIEFPARLHRI